MYSDTFGEIRCLECYYGYRLHGNMCIEDSLIEFACPEETEDFAVPDHLAGCINCMLPFYDSYDEATGVDTSSDTFDWNTVTCSFHTADEYDVEPCYEGYQYDDFLGICVEEDKSEPEWLFSACPPMPEDILDETTGEVVTEAVFEHTEAHLYGCAVCKTDILGNNEWVRCMECLPGFFNLNGGCYNVSMGVHTPNDNMCGNCAECLRFDLWNEYDSFYTCNECQDGFYQDKVSEYCEAPAENHCSWQNDAYTGMLIGMANE